MLPAVAGAHERELSRHDGLHRPDAVEEKRIQPPSGKDAQAVSLSALFVVHPEGDGLAGRGGAGALLGERRVTRALDWGREPAAQDVLRVADGKRGWGSARDRDRPQPESVVDRIGKQRARFCVRKHVEHQDQNAGTFRTGEDVDVRDVHDGIC